MLITGQINVSKVDIATSNVPIDGLYHIYKKDVISKLVKKIEDCVEVEYVDNLEQSDTIDMYAEICVLNKQDTHKVFDLLERLKNTTREIPTHLINEIKDILA